jgi:hypothetical protein
LAGEIWAAGLLRNEEAAELDDELEAVGAGDRIPADSGVAVFEVVFGIKNRMELADFNYLGGGANVEGGIGLNPKGEGHRGSHDTPIMQIQGDLFRQKAMIHD